MDHIEIASDTAMSTYPILFAQYEFSNPFWTPRDGAGIRVWSDLPPHEIYVTLLLSRTVPQWETVKRLLLEVRRLVSAPKSLNRAAVSPSGGLPNHLPTRVLSFLDRWCGYLDGKHREDSGGLTNIPGSFDSRFATSWTRWDGTS